MLISKALHLIETPPLIIYTDSSLHADGLYGLGMVFFREKSKANPNESHEAKLDSTFVQTHACTYAHTSVFQSILGELLCIDMALTMVLLPLRGAKHNVLKTRFRKQLTHIIIRTDVVNMEYLLHHDCHATSYASERKRVRELIRRLKEMGIKVSIEYIGGKQKYNDAFHMTAHRLAKKI